MLDRLWSAFMRIRDDTCERPPIVKHPESVQPSQSEGRCRMFDAHFETRCLTHARLAFFWDIAKRQQSGSGRISS